MQDKPLDKIIDSLGGKKKGRKRKKETTPTPMSEVEFFNAIQTTSKSTGFDQEKLDSVAEAKEVSYEKDFSELKDMVQKVLSKNTPKETKFKKIDPRDIKKLDKYTFKTAVIKTEKGMTQLPALRTGGVVTSPTQALIGENGPEAIVPLEKLQSLYDQMPGISREGFGTLVRNFMPNADHIQVDSLFDRVRNPKTEVPQFGIPTFDPSRGESYLDTTNPVEAVRSRGRPRVEEMESLQEYRAKLDRLFADTHRDQKPLLKTDEELQRERFERNKGNRKDRGEILNLFKIIDERDDLTPEMREKLLESAKSVNPEIFRQIERDRGFAEDDRKMQERMELIEQPRKDLEKRRAEYEAQYQARDDIPGTKAYKEKMAKREAERARRDREYEKKMADLEAQRKPVPSPKSIEPLTSGAGGLSYNDLMDPDYFKKKYSEKENKKITDRAARKRRAEKRFADEFVDMKLEERYKNMKVDPGKTLGDGLEGAGKLLGGAGQAVGALIGGIPKIMGIGEEVKHDETPDIFDVAGGLVPEDHPFFEHKLRPFRKETPPDSVSRDEPVFKGPDVNPVMFSKNIAALQELQEKYKQSQSGREQTSSQNTPRVQPSNPAKVKTPHATGVGGGGGGMGFFDMIGMANKMLPIWRIGNG